MLKVRFALVLSADSAIVANEQGSFTTPSFVSFTEQERLIGEAAKNQAAMNPANTIFDIKYVPPGQGVMLGSTRTRVNSGTGA